MNARRRCEALGVRVALAGDDRGVSGGHLARRAAGDARRVLVGDGDLHGEERRLASAIRAPAGADLAGRLRSSVLQVIDGEAAQSNRVALAVADVDGAGGRHRRVGEAVLGRAADRGRPLAGAVGCRVLGHEDVVGLGVRVDGVCRIVRLWRRAADEGPHRRAVAHGSRAAAHGRVLGPDARAVGLVELDEVAALVARQGAGADGGGAREGAGEIEVVARGLDREALAAADLDLPLGNGTGGAAHVEGGDDGVARARGGDSTGTEGVDVGAGDLAGNVFDHRGVALTPKRYGARR